jgi:hypothetical protein
MPHPVTNAAVTWNKVYLAVAIEELKVEGCVVNNEDVAMKMSRVCHRRAARTLTLMGDTFYMGVIMRCLRRRWCGV